MEVILKENVANLGKAGDIVKVKDGYARNFLIPKGQAIPATDGNIKALQEQIRKKLKEKNMKEENLKSLLEKIKGVELTIKKLAAEDNKLFGSVSEIDIVDGLKSLGIEIEKNNVILDKHIKEPSEFLIMIKLKEGFETNIKVKIIGEK